MYAYVCGKNAYLDQINSGIYQLISARGGHYQW